MQVSANSPKLPGFKENTWEQMILYNSASQTHDADDNRSAEGSRLSHSGKFSRMITAHVPVSSLELTKQ